MGVKERKSREKEYRKKSILNAAKKVFYKKGFKNTTLEDIANICELSVGTIYLYFKSKEEIYVSLLFASIEYFTKEIEKIEKENITDLVKIKKLWDYFYSFYKKNPELFKIVMFLNNENLNSFLLKETIENINKVSGENFYVLSRIIQKATKENFLKEDSQDLAIIFWSTFIGFIHFTETRENLGLPLNSKKLHNKIWKLFDFYLKNKDARR